MNQAIIEFQNVSVTLNANPIHRDLSFSVQRGESITLLGPSGTGKTVLLKLIVGLLRPTSGSLTLFGQEMLTATDKVVREIRKQVGFLFQGAALFDSLNVYENIAYSLRQRGERDENFIKHKVHEKLELVGLSGREELYPSELSGGQKKRVGLARALASEPEVMLFDEPTTGLDPTSARRIDDLIVDLNQSFGITTLSVTHDISSASRISKRWILLAHGELVADGQSDALCRNNQSVIDFVGGNWMDEG
ncbi:MAG: ATP-binding cassette domain-containing protein [Bdellovibrionales bacterium]|nr:ATP-binding cassette domain-containing protein [Bdellovibrionales bacterium]